MRLLVTGGAGFIGSNFIRYWTQRHPDDTVINVDAVTYAGDPRNLHDVEQASAERYVFVRGDVADAQFVHHTFVAHRPDVVVNFAAESHNSRAILDPGRFVRTNVLGAQALLDAARGLGVRRFHHISTCEVYGDLPLDSRDAFRESSPYRPRTPYNASKAAADLLVRAYHETYGLPVTITNSANTYGPWQHPEKLIPLFTTNALEGLHLPVYRSSQNRREWVHVSDHCRAIELVLEGGRPGETYHLGTGDERSIDEVADEVLRIVGRPSTLKRYVADRPGHDRRYLLDSTKIRTQLGWNPVIKWHNGLATTVQWYADHQAWWRPKKERLRTELDETAWSGVNSRG